MKKKKNNRFSAFGMLDPATVFLRSARRGAVPDNEPTDEIDRSLRNLKHRIAYAERVRAATVNAAANRGAMSRLPEFAGDWSAIRMASAIGALPGADHSSERLDTLVRLVTETNTSLRKIHSAGVPVRYID